MPEDEGGHSDLVPEGVKKKVGPLPLWAWVAIPAALIFVYLAWTRSKQGSSSSSASSGQAGSMAGTSPDLGVTTADPMTAQQLAAAMQQLNQNLLALQNPPSSSVPSGGVGSVPSPVSSGTFPVSNPLVHIPIDPTPVQSPAPGAGTPVVTSPPQLVGFRVLPGASWFDWRSGRQLEPKFQSNVPVGQVLGVGSSNGAIRQIGSGDWGIQSQYLQPVYK